MVLLRLAVLCLLALPVMGEGETSIFSSLVYCSFPQGSTEMKEFKQTNSIRVIYYYKKDVPSLKFFLKELDKAAEYLDLYGVKTGIVDCTDMKNTGVTECEGKSEKNVYTYRSGNLLLSLELETMFDVNSIMSNILQLVLLREVPILQSSKELQKYLMKFRGKQDVIFGHMKAIGTFDHRVFMEVAFAYQEKIKFAICTDKEATTLFEERPTSSDRSTVWWVATKSMSPDSSQLTSVQYKGDLNLAAFAKFAMSISLPKMFDIPGDGTEHPYSPLNLSLVRFYYNQESQVNMYEKAEAVSKRFLGLVSIILINMDSAEGREFKIPASPPAASIQLKGEDSEQFAADGFTSDSLAVFLNSFLERVQTQAGAPDDHMYMTEFEEEDDESREPREIRDAPPNLNIEEVEMQDDEVAEAVYRLRRKQINLDLVPALTDKTFPQQITSPLVIVMFYFPFDYISMANLYKLVDAAEHLGQPSKLRLARVNCYDWTDVCQQQQITIWPTLRLFRSGVHSWDYKGPQDTQAKYSTLKLLDLTPPIHLADQDTVKSYLAGDSILTDITNTSLVAFFSPAHKKEISMYRELSQDVSDRILYAYTDIKEAADIVGQHGGKLPALLMCKYDDPLQPHVLYSGPFSKESIKDFIYNNKLPKLPELTPLMFPELRRRSSSLVILFADSTDQSGRSHDALREVIKVQTYTNVSFTLMNIPHKNSIGYKVLSQYTTSPSVPFLSFVNFNKGEVYNFEGTLYDSTDVTKWLGTVIDRSVQPSVMLSEGEWKPKNKGYEFLKIIDYEKEQVKAGKKGRKDKKNQNMNPAMEDMDETEGHHLPYQPMTREMEGEEDTDMRKDLIGLVNSRLYHQNQARQEKHSQQAQEGQGQTTQAAGHDPGEL